MSRLELTVMLKSIDGDRLVMVSTALELVAGFALDHADAHPETDESPGWVPVFLKGKQFAAFEWARLGPSKPAPTIGDRIAAALEVMPDA